eukprot:SAG31_NODE_417_length_15907_cov_6.901759_17_plen_58_part_00
MVHAFARRLSLSLHPLGWPPPVVSPPVATQVATRTDAPSDSQLRRPSASRARVPHER